MASTTGIIGLVVGGVVAIIVTTTLIDSVNLDSTVKTLLDLVAILIAAAIIVYVAGSM
jgi:hypothetical protein